MGLDVPRPVPAPAPRRTLADGRAAPALWVRFECPACKTVEIADAYRGPALHTCKRPCPIMVVLGLVDPLDVPAGT